MTVSLMLAEIALTPRGDFYEGGDDGEVVRALSGDDEIEPGDGADTIKGGRGDDTIFDSRGADRIFGGAGDDGLQGGLARDRLVGGTGDDQLIGGRSGDRLRGGAGSDEISLGSDDIARDFVIYRDVSESTIAQRDSIFSFRPAEDIIDLRRVDADPATAGDDLFEYIGTAAFSGVVGEVRYETYADGFDDGVDVLADVDGDGVADFVARLRGTDFLTEANFLL